MAGILVVSGMMASVLAVFNAVGMINILHVYD